ncbi:hypothetical protein Tco_0993035 [Tanacetum coccineum]|uniref:Uncharacterized protein n=1 Tax=Tanacetum coccineum TaxID=301880 RepID=A0ABQ5F3S2_9ASTR
MNAYHVEFGMLRVTPSDIQHSTAYSDLRVLQIGIRANVIENQVKTVMSSASSDVTYTFVYTDSEPSKTFKGADDEEISEGGILRVIVLGYDGLPIQPVAPPSSDYIPGPEDPQTPPVPQDEDEREPMFVHVHDPAKYIPLEDEHEFPTEEQPLSPVYSSPTAEDDDDGDSSRDDANDEDEDDEDEEEEHLAPADSTIVVPVDEPVFPPEGTEPVIPPPSTDITIRARITVRPQTSISLPPEAEVERLLAMTTPSPSPPISLSPPSAGERLARCTSPPAHSSPLPMPSPLLPSSGCPTSLRIASTQAFMDAVTVALPSPPLPPLPPSLYIPPPVDQRDEIFECLPARDAEERRQGIRDVGYGIRDTWVDPVEAVPEIAPMTVEEVNTRVIELAELHEHDTQDLYALLEDAQDSRSRISQRVDMDSQRVNLLMRDRMTLQEIVWMVKEEAYASREAWAHSIGLSTPDTATAAGYSHSDIASESLRVIRDTRQEMSDMQAELLSLREQQRRARQPGPEARIPDHQNASGDADSHI